MKGDDEIQFRPCRHLAHLARDGDAVARARRQMQTLNAELKKLEQRERNAKARVRGVDVTQQLEGGELVCAPRYAVGSIQTSGAAPQRAGEDGGTAPDPTPAVQLEAQGCTVTRHRSGKGELREVAELQRDPAAAAAAWAKAEAMFWRWLEKRAQDRQEASET